MSDPSSSPISAQCVACSQDLWFSGGTVIIQTTDTQFRVHTDILSRNSDVFRDMLSLPQPIDAETIDGSPMVRVEGTTTNELRLFLSSMYGSIDCQEMMENPNSLVILLYMSHKYLAPDLRRRVLRRLSPMFPSTYEGYLEAENEVRKNNAPFDHTSLECCSYVANIFRQTDSSALLPVTLYWLCRSNVGAIIESNLSAGDKLTVLRGRSRLASFAKEEVFPHLFHAKGQLCLTCILAPLECNVNYLSSFLTDDLWLDPLLTRKQFEGNRSAVCHDACKEAFMEMYEAGRKAAWQKLPEFFGLPPWSELRGG